jgi:hypothetical protein
MSRLNIFLPFSKVDIEKRTVYGMATGETPDRSGEICDYASTRPFYEKWSGGVRQEILVVFCHALLSLRARPAAFASGEQLTSACRLE